MTLNRRYVITGYDPNGSSAYWKRNVSEDCAMEEMNDARDAGWTDMRATPESF